MKKIILVALAAVAVTSASAEGYQVNTLSAKQLGMAHTGVSQKLNSESVWFNPAAAAHQEQKFTIAGGVTGINAVATYKNGDVTAESDNKLSTPLYLNANYKITDDLAVGVVFNTPFGSSMNWGDTWAGAHQVQNISLQAYNVQPTVSYKFLDGKLSVGAGLMLSWGSFELSKSALAVGTSSNSYVQSAIIAATMAGYGVDEATAAIYAAEQLSAVESVGNNPLATVTLEGDAKLAYGFNIGAMYDISDKWSVALSYRSKMMMAVDAGKTSVEYANDIVNSVLSSSLDPMTDGTFAAELPMPSTLSWGVTYYPSDKWTVSLEMQNIGWGTYENLNFDFENESATDSSDIKDYDNTMIYRIGAQYNALDWLTARAGFYYDESPVQDEYFSPETPSMNKLGYTCGVSFMPCSNNRNFSIDLAYAYIAPASYNRTSTLKAFSGTYRAVANTFSVGASWGF